MIKERAWWTVQWKEKVWEEQRRVDPLSTEGLGALWLSRIQCELVGTEQDRRKKQCGNKCQKFCVLPPTQMSYYWFQAGFSKTEMEGKTCLSRVGWSSFSHAFLKCKGLGHSSPLRIWEFRSTWDTHESLERIKVFIQQMPNWLHNMIWTQSQNGFPSLAPWTIPL